MHEAFFGMNAGITALGWYNPKWKNWMFYDLKGFLMGEVKYARLSD